MTKTTCYKQARHGLWCSLFVCLLLIGSCSERGEQMNAVYYWSTTFKTDSIQMAFFHDNNIRKLYLRFFDVVPTDDGSVMPNASVRFASPVPNGVDIVPVVYIVNGCFQQSCPTLDSLILQRVLQMCETHDIAQVHELQIDCDWTSRTRKTYMDFLQRLRSRAAKQGVIISATIRLHQLGEAPPPVDRGVLMMYNTGDVTRLDCEHPILDMKDAAPYLRKLSQYDLPLATAYPVFAWSVLFRNGKYVGIMHSDDELPVLQGDSIVVRQPPLDMVMKARKAVQQAKPAANDEIILFDISNNNINRISQYHYEKILHP